VKRSSLIFSVFLGWLFLGEERPGRRLAGAVVMCGGMALIIV
jgi:drug/metabolite transporter (DMT)-like permease